jgi:iron complex transport system substrate-binding protein
MNLDRRLGVTLSLAMAIIAPRALSASSPAERPPVVITDSLGRRVEIPGHVGRIISLEPEITRAIVALGGGEKLVGLDFFLRYHDHLFPIVYPAGAKLPVVSNQGQDLNFELALHLRPDLVFSSPSEHRSTEAIQQKLRVPVVALASMGKFDNLLSEIDVLGRILGREERAREVTAYFQARIAAVRREVERVPEANRSTVYLSFWGSLLRTPAAYEPVEAAGGVNRAAGLVPSYRGTAGATVSIEQILAWDPDIILIQGNYLPAERQVTVDGILGDGRLASLKAVRRKSVHYTFGFWYWWDPALVLIETLYLGRLFYPERFRGFDLEREGNEIFEKFYGIRGGFSSLSRVLGCDEWVRD